MMELPYKVYQKVRIYLDKIFKNFNNRIPYVPPSRCKVITTWYGPDKLQSMQNFSVFQQDIILADQLVAEEAGYIISDGNSPSKLKNCMKIIWNFLKSSK